MKIREKIAEWLSHSYKKLESASLNERRVLVVCMGLSLLVWFFVKMSQRYESRGTLQLEYQLPVGRVFAEPPQASMPFKYAGTGWKLLKMSLLHRTPSLSFQLSNSVRQSLVRTVLSKKIEQELGLSVLELGQDKIDIHLDTLLSKKVPVKLDTLISFENGYYFRDSIVLTPDSIEVFGASQLIDTLAFVETEPLKMKCPEMDFTSTLKIVNPSPGLAQLSTEKTKVFMPIEQYTEKMLNIQIMVLNERDSVRLLPASVTLKCVVGVSRYNEIVPSGFRIVAVIDNESTSTTVPLTLVRQPSWVKSTQFTPQAVEYLIVQ